jgi:hypothetical protein
MEAVTPPGAVAQVRDHARSVRVNQEDAGDIRDGSVFRHPQMCVERIACGRQDLDR